MSKKTIIVIITVLVVAIGVWWFFSLLSTNKTNQENSSKSILGSLFPFGLSNNKGGPNTTPEETRNEGEPSGDTGLTYDPLVQISTKKAAGFVTFKLPEEIQTVVHDIRDLTGTAPEIKKVTKLPLLRFMEQGTGHIYDVEVRGQNIRKISSTTIPRALIALFDEFGHNVVTRFIKQDNETIATHFGAIVEPTTSADGEIKGDFLVDNIADMAISSDKKNYVFLMPTSEGIAGMTMKADGSAKKQIFASPFTEWLLEWTGRGVTVTSKASATVPGMLFGVTTDGTLQRLMASQKGLTTKLSPDGKTLLYSVSSGNTVSLHVYQFKDSLDRDTGLHTLPEKCAWTPDSKNAYCGTPAATTPFEYPDAWYQGLMHFEDGIWKIEADTATTSILTAGENKLLDVTNPSVDQSGRYLVFINKKDSTLWSFDMQAPKQR